MQTYILILGACGLVLVSYLLDWVGRRFRAPSVLFLIAFGMGLRALADHLALFPPVTEALLPVLGTLGLILIVLEGGLDITLSRQKVPIIRRAFFAALVPMLVYVAGIGVFLQAYFGAPWHASLLNAVPLAIISSAVAISSVRQKSPDTREFVVYESVFSDILGIILFTVLSNNETFSGWLLLIVPGEIILVLAITAVGCLLLIFMLERITHHVKYVPIITLMVAIYAGAKMLHLSPLIFILVFGVMVNNVRLLGESPLGAFFRTGNLVRELGEFKHLVSEATFLVRALFFVLFGFGTQFGSLLVWEPFLMALGFLGLIFGVRVLFLFLLFGKKITPIWFVLPRGLITVLLFLSIPAAYVIPGFGTVTVMWLVLQSCTLMMFGLLAPERGEKRLPDLAPSLGENP